MWVEKANIKVGRLWNCRRCGCGVRALQEPVAFSGYMWVWVRRYTYFVSKEGWREAVKRGDVKATEVPSDCDEALVLNVMTS